MNRYLGRPATSANSRHPTGTRHHIDAKAGHTSGNQTEDRNTRSVCPYRDRWRIRMDGIRLPRQIS